MIDKVEWERAEIKRSAFEATHTPDAALKADPSSWRAISLRRRRRCIRSSMRIHCSATSPASASSISDAGAENCLVWRAGERASSVSIFRSR